MNKQLILGSLLLSFLIVPTVNAEERHLSLGYVYTATPPLAYPDEAGHAGALIDFATEIGKRSGIVFDPQKEPQALITDRLKNKKIDASIAGIYKNEKKDDGFLYTDSFLDDNVINAYRSKGLKRNKIKSAGDPITGTFVAAYDLLERTFNDDYNADCEAVERGERKYQDLAGNPPIEPCDRDRSYIGLNIIRSGYFDHIFHKGVRDIDFHLVLQKEDEALLPALNKAIAEMKQDGTIDRIFKEYLVKRKGKGIIDGEE